MKLLDVQRERERTLLVERLEMFRQHGEDFLGRALLHVERPAVAYQRRDVHEGVIGRLVGDAVGVGSMGANAQAAERKDARAEGTRMELVEERVEGDLILDVRGILDDQVRQGESGGGLT